MWCEYRASAFCWAVAQELQFSLPSQELSSDASHFRRLNCKGWSRSKYTFDLLYIQERGEQEQRWKVLIWVKPGIEFFSGVVALVAHSSIKDFNAEKSQGHNVRSLYNCCWRIWWLLQLSGTLKLSLKPATQAQSFVICCRIRLPVPFNCAQDKLCTMSFLKNPWIFIAQWITSP